MIDFKRVLFGVNIGSVLLTCIIVVIF